MSTKILPPLITSTIIRKLQSALNSGVTKVECSLDLQRSTSIVEVNADSWGYDGQRFPYLLTYKERTIYYWAGESFLPAARYAGSLIKLIPTDWGAPTFEIDGIKMLPTARISPYQDAGNKVALIEPKGKVILDTCGGLGYFAAWCLQGQAKTIISYEKNPDVIWLRNLNPWSPQEGGKLTLNHADIVTEVESLQTQSIDAILHDPPRFAIAGELYSQNFYDQLARIIKRKGKMFHYTGSPNKLTSGRDVPQEVTNRLRHAGFITEFNGDGILAIKK